MEVEANSVPTAPSAAPQGPPNKRGGRRKPYGKPKPLSSLRAPGLDLKYSQKRHEMNTGRRTITHVLPVSLFGIISAFTNYLDETRMKCVGELKTFYQQNVAQKFQECICAFMIAASVRRDHCARNGPNAPRLNRVYTVERVEATKEITSVVPKAIASILTTLRNFDVNGHTVVPGKVSVPQQQRLSALLDLDWNDFTTAVTAAAGQPIMHAPVVQAINQLVDIIPGWPQVAIGGIFMPPAYLIQPPGGGYPVAQWYRTFSTWCRAHNDNSRVPFNLFELKGSLSQAVRFQTIEDEMRGHCAFAVQPEMVVHAGAIPTGLDFQGAETNDYLQYRGHPLAEEHTVVRGSCINSWLSQV